MNLKAKIPPALRLKAKLLSRSYKDRVSGATRQFAKRKDAGAAFPFSVSLTQPIKPGPYFDNKVHNIQTGISRIEHLVIQPGELFSFWRMVGHPTEQNGFRVGRNIIGGLVREDYGGGLCQLASIIYHLSLVAGLSVMERHNHSVDIYKEEDRFTPLGADAAVVYGYKDLRVKNDLATPCRFVFTANNEHITFTIQGVQAIHEADIRFQRKDDDHSREVTTISVAGGREQVLSKITYGLP